MTDCEDPGVSDPDEKMPEWAIRLEAKVDVALTRQGDRLDRHGEMIDDHEKRLRTTEQKSYVTPAGLMAAIATTIATLGGFAALVDRLAG